MPVNLISEDELRLALSPHRVDAEQFQAAVLERVNQGSAEEMDPIMTLHPLLRAAASFLPLEVLTAGQASRNAVASLSIAGALSKLLGYVAFPAISLFLVLGSAFFGAAGIRKIHGAHGSQAIDQEALRERVKRWRHQHSWGSWLLVAATIALAWWGATWPMFLAYIASTLILLYILRSFARIGIGDRRIVGESCAGGLALLGQTAVFAGIGDQDIHLIDQALLLPLFFAGVLIVTVVMSWGSHEGLPVLRTALFMAFTLSVTAWFISPILWTTTPSRIYAYVESFDRAEFGYVSWRQWEIVSNWAIQSKPDLDLSRPRTLLAEEIANGEDPMILGSAFRAGLVDVDQIRQIKNYETKLGTLLKQPISDPLSPLDFNDWVIRAAVLRHDLTPEQRDYLVERLHVTLRDSRGSLQEPLLATQLLEVLGQPVDAALYRKDIQALLMRLHSKERGGFQRAGGFKANEIVRVGELEATSDAVRLMEIYGIPNDFDVNWVRSFLRPSFIRSSLEQRIAAVTLDRLNRLPGVARLSWYEAMYYERSFLAAVVLIGLCVYATAISPKNT
jgi:hypothetical protein